MLAAMIFSEIFLDRTPPFLYNAPTSQNRPSGRGTAMAFKDFRRSLKVGIRSDDVKCFSVFKNGPFNQGGKV
jgi:hypothetical protein